MGIYNTRARLGAVRIDALYQDGTYLSDLIEDGKSSKEQIELYDQFDVFEKYIVEHQTSKIASHFPDLQGKQYERLFKLLDSLEEKR